MTGWPTVTDLTELERQRKESISTDRTRFSQLWPVHILDALDDGHAQDLAPDWREILRVDSAHISITKVGRLVEWMLSPYRDAFPDEARQAAEIAMEATEFDEKLLAFMAKRYTKPSWQARAWIAARTNAPALLAILVRDSAPTVRRAAAQRLEDLQGEPAQSPIA
jgi:hypothetical protein